MTLKEQLIRDEGGFQRTPYRDSGGKLTIGYGRNLDDVGISRGEADLLLNNDLAPAIEAVAAFSWIGTVDEIRRAALVNLCFNVGAAGLQTFTKMLAACARGDWGTAAAELLDSRYHQQVGARAERLAQQLVIGEWI